MVGKTHQDGYGECDLISRAKLIRGWSTVSYTHLDVYKRQEQDGDEIYCEDGQAISLLRDVKKTVKYLLISYFPNVFAE